MLRLLRNIFVRGFWCIGGSWIVVHALEFLWNNVTLIDRPIQKIIEDIVTPYAGPILGIVITVVTSIIVFIFGSLFFYGGLALLYITMLFLIGSYVAYLYEEIVGVLQWMLVRHNPNEYTPYQSYSEKSSHEQNSKEKQLRNVLTMLVAGSIAYTGNYNFDALCTLVKSFNEEFFFTSFGLVNTIEAGLIVFEAAWQTIQHGYWFLKILFGGKVKDDAGFSLSMILFGMVGNIVGAIFAQFSSSHGFGGSSSGGSSGGGSSADADAARRQQQWNDAMRSNPERFIGHNPGWQGPKL